jgi:hypothetical protein
MNNQKYNSELEIIGELKRRNRHAEWVKCGGLFGLTSDTLQAKIFLVRPFKYYDINGNIVNVSMVQSTYRVDVDNIPVFRQVVQKDPHFVDVDKFKFCSLLQFLSTSGLATCCALSMIIGDKKFLAHITATTEAGPIVYHINKALHEQKLDKTSIQNIQIFVGDLDTTYSLYKISSILNLLSINEKDVITKYMYMFDHVRV